MSAPEVLTVQEVASLLKVHVDQVTDLIDEKVLRASNINRTPKGKPKGKPRWRIDVEDLAAFLKERANVTGPTKARKKRKPAKVPQRY